MQYIQMYSGIIFESKLKLLLKPFLLQCGSYRNYQHQCMADKKKGKCVGDGGGNDYNFFMLHIEHGGKCLTIFD